MATPSQTPIARPSIYRRMRPYILAAVAIAALALAVWGTLKAFRRFPQLAEWEVPLGITTAALVAFLILWKVPQWQVGAVTGLEPKERFDRINEARKTLAQIVGGIAILAGFYSTAQNLKVTQQSFALAQEGQITDRFTKAIEQLGAVDSNGKKKLEVRLGGIYSLERIANESDDLHWPVMEVLTAYIRNNAPMPEGQELKRLGNEFTAPDTDVQAILTILGRRNVSSEVPTNEWQDLWLNLNDTYLRGANLTGANLSGATLNRTDLSYSLLIGADLRKTEFRGASLFKANLIGANLTDADLYGADLRGALNVSQKQLDSAMGNRETKLPLGLTVPNEWHLELR